MKIWLGSSLQRYYLTSFRPPAPSRSFARRNAEEAWQARTPAPPLQRMAGGHFPAARGERLSLQACYFNDNAGDCAEIRRCPRAHGACGPCPQRAQPEWPPTRARPLPDRLREAWRPAEPHHRMVPPRFRRPTRTPRAPRTPGASPAAARRAAAPQTATCACDERAPSALWLGRRRPSPPDGPATQPPTHQRRPSLP